MAVRVPAPGSVPIDKDAAPEATMMPEVRSVFPTKSTVAAVALLLCKRVLMVVVSFPRAMFPELPLAEIRTLAVLLSEIIDPRASIFV